MEGAETQCFGAFLFWFMFNNRALLQTEWVARRTADHSEGVK